MIAVAHYTTHRGEDLFEAHISSTWVGRLRILHWSDVPVSPSPGLGEYISDVYVPYSFRNSGIGAILYKKALATLDYPFVAHIHRGNAPSLALHRSLGFERAYEFHSFSGWDAYQWNGYRRRETC